MPLSAIHHGDVADVAYASAASVLCRSARLFRRNLRCGSCRVAHAQLDSDSAIDVTDFYIRAMRQVQLNASHFGPAGGVISDDTVGENSRRRNRMNAGILLPDGDAGEIHQHQVVARTVLGMTECPVRSDGYQDGIVAGFNPHSRQLRHGTCSQCGYTSQQYDSQQLL